MARLDNHLVYDLLELADFLAEQKTGRSALIRVFRRRAVSNAYYAVFHALSFICVDAFLGWGSETELVDPLYRTLDHAMAKKRLAGQEARTIAPEFVRAAFAHLQKNRHNADYGSPTVTFAAAEVFDLIDKARQAITGLEELDTLQRRRLAVLLLAKPR